ncbi:MAG: lipid IV(A) 3-deoxy-D-manno-octulosonic acid transferase [Pseudomonadales bacterium]|nr:lipid IV(A) 3-deoxy-D-manno-octulosonic acid transferase [Pseudomonadales bacterium]
MVRTFYTILFLHLLPLFILRLYWRSIKAPAYRGRLHERFANIPKRKSDKPLIWIHAVSVGETIAAVPMIKALQQQYPEHEICITSTTPTGSDRVKAAFSDSVLHYYLPYDLPSLFARFITRLNPALVIIMETELWPNMLAVCKEKGVPAILANGRMSPRSAKGYQRFSSLTAPMLASITTIAAQSKVDAQRFIDLGASQDTVNTTGSIKFDISLEGVVQTRMQALQQQLQIQQRKVMVFASTHKGEDEQILVAVKPLLQGDATALAFIVPRHPERFDAVQTLAEAQGISVQTVSSGAAVAASTQLLIGDTMGDMLSFFGLSHIAFIGGSLIPHGGHNFLEAAAWSLPIISGPTVFNFQSIADTLVAADALELVADGDALKALLQAWLQDETPFKKKGEAANKMLQENRGALGKLLAVIDQQL